MADSEVSDHEHHTVAMDTEEEEEATEIIAKIMDRVIQQSVPAVEPHEQSAIPLPEATELAAWAATADKGVLNAFMDKEFDEYAPTVANNTSRTEWQIRATAQNVVWTALCALLPETNLYSLPAAHWPQLLNNPD